MKLELNFRPDSTEYSIGLVDHEGNGIIVAHGNLGGCSFLNREDTKRRQEVLEQMVADWNDQRGS